MFSLYIWRICINQNCIQWHFLWTTTDIGNWSKRIHFCEVSLIIFSAVTQFSIQILYLEVCTSVLMQLRNTDAEQRHPRSVCVFKFQLIEHPAGPEAVGVPLVLIPLLLKQRPPCYTVSYSSCMLKNPHIQAQTRTALEYVLQSKNRKLGANTNRTRYKESRRQKTEKDREQESIHRGCSLLSH